MTSRQRAVMVALLGATITLSGCTPVQPIITGPSTTPTGPPTTTPGVPATSPTNPSSAGPPTVTPFKTSGAWAALHDAQGCPTTPWVPSMHTGLALLSLTSISDCAVFVTRSDIPLGVWSRGGLDVFPSMSEPAEVSPPSSSVVPFPGGFWLATYDTSDPNVVSVPALWSERRDHPVRVSLPADFCGFEALSPYVPGLLVAGDTGRCQSSSTTDSVLYSVGADDHATLLKAFPQAHVYSTGSDGNDIAVAGITITGQAFVAVWYGQEWVESTLGPAGRVAGVTIHGDTIVTVYNEVKNRAPVALVTAISHDRGRTWATARTPNGDAGIGLLGYLGSTLIGELYLPDATTWLYTLTTSDTWEPLKGVPEPATEGIAHAALAPCGFWIYQGFTLTYHTVTGVCPD